MPRPLMVNGSVLLIGGGSMLSDLQAPQINSITAVKTGDTTATVTIVCNRIAGNIFYIVNTSATAVAGDCTLTQAIGPGYTDIIYVYSLTPSTQYYAHAYLLCSDGTTAVANSTAFTTDASTTNVAPTAITPTAIAVYDNTSIGTTLLTVVGNGSPAPTFTEITDAAGLFAISSTGAITSTAALTAGGYTYRVRATNVAGFFEQNISITVNAAPVGDGVADATVATLGALQTQLSSWSTNWSGTTPAGKTNSDPRVINWTAGTYAGGTLSGYSFPQNVIVRSSTFPAWGVNISTQLSVSNCNRLILKSMEFSGVDHVNCTNCYVDQSFCQDNGDIPSSENYGFYLNGAGNTSCGVRDTVIYGWRKGVYLSTGTDLRVERCVFNNIGGDDIHISAGITVNPVILDNWFSKNRRPASLDHADMCQTSYTGSTGMIFRGNIGTRSTQQSYGAIDDLQGCFADGTVSGATITQNLLNIKSQHVCSVSGSTPNTISFNAFMFSPEGATINPSNWCCLVNSGASDVLNANYVDCPSAPAAGPNGISGLIGSQGSPNYNGKLTYYTGPFGLNMIGHSIMPLAGQRTHWSHANPCGPTIRLQEIFVQGKHPGNTPGPIAAIWQALWNGDGFITS